MLTDPFLALVVGALAIGLNLAARSIRGFVFGEPDEPTRRIDRLRAATDSLAIRFWLLFTALSAIAFLVQLVRLVVQTIS